MTVSRFFARDGETGEYGDIVWRKSGPPHLNRYVVSVGDKVIGQIFGPSRRRGGWTAVSHADRERLIGMRSVEGFRTRWDATDYLLNVGFRYGPQDPMTLEAVGDRMRSEQRIRELIAANDEKEGRSCPPIT